MFPIGKKTGFHLTMLLYRKICAFSSYTVIAIHFSLFTELPCSICSWAGFCILFWHLPRILHMARGSCHRSHVFSYIVDVWPYVMRLVVALWPRWPFWGVIWEDSKPSFRKEATMSFPLGSKWIKIDVYLIFGKHVPSISFWGTFALRADGTFGETEAYRRATAIKCECHVNVSVSWPLQKKRFLWMCQGLNDAWTWFVSIMMILAHNSDDNIWQH